MNIYIESLKKITNDLNHSDKINVLNCDINEGTDVGYVEDYLANNGWSATRDYINFCSSLDQSIIEWEIKPDIVTLLGLDTNMCVTGRMKVDSFETALASDFWLNIVWEECKRAQSISTDTQLVMIDFFDNDTSGCVCLQSVNKTIGNDLFIFERDSGAIPLNISLEEYFHQMQKYRCIYGWQKAITNNAKYKQQSSVVISMLFDK
jgi:hypothetical protein